jgi:hypothetical protein
MFSPVRLLTLALLAAFLTTGATCQRRDDPIPPPLEHTVTVERVYVPIPAELTRPCPAASGRLREVIRVARQRRAAVEDCNARMTEIRGIQGTAVPKGE